MGCDIHLYTEKKKDGKWISISPLKYAWGDYDYKKRQLSQIYDGRDYTLFGWLAQVRTTQESGFEPKGFPNDSSKEILNIFKRWGRDAHTPNYLTLKELKSKLESKVLEEGLMEAKQKKKLDSSIKSSKDTNWDLLYPHCQMTTIEGYVEFSYQVPMDYMFKYFVKKVIKYLEDYTYDTKLEEHDEDSVRIVFWFDN